jgi:hypothetical protein
VNSGFRYEVVENWANRGYTQRVVVIPYQCFGTTYWSHLSRVKNPRREENLLVSLTLEDGTDSLSRNFGRDLPLQAVLYNSPEERNSLVG